jgi:hypothetical protein
MTNYAVAFVLLFSIDFSPEMEISRKILGTTPAMYVRHAGGPPSAGRRNQWSRDFQPDQ